MPACVACAAAPVTSERAAGSVTTCYVVPHEGVLSADDYLTVNKVTKPRISDSSLRPAWVVTEHGFRDDVVSHHVGDCAPLVSRESHHRHRVQCPEVDE